MHFPFSLFPFLFSFVWVYSNPVAGLSMSLAVFAKTSASFFHSFIDRPPPPATTWPPRITTLTNELYRKMKRFRATLPPGFLFCYGPEMRFQAYPLVESAERGARKAGKVYGGKSHIFAHKY